jgi:hypothetical protein
LAVRTIAITFQLRNQKNTAGMRSPCRILHSSFQKFSVGYTPGPPFKGRGGEGRKGRTEGERRGSIRDTVGEEGVVWDREGEEGMRVIQRKGKGREGRGREGRKGGEEERRKMTWPPKEKFLDSPLF